MFCMLSLPHCVAFCHCLDVLHLVTASMFCILSPPHCFAFRFAQYVVDNDPFLLEYLDTHVLELELNRWASSGIFCIEAR